MLEFLSRIDLGPAINVNNLRIGPEPGAFRFFPGEQANNGRDFEQRLVDLIGLDDDDIELAVEELVMRNDEPFENQQLNARRVRL